VFRLAWQLLTHDRLRFVVALSGVSVSVMLVLTQLGLYAGFLSTASMLFENSSADLWLTRANTRAFDDSVELDDRTYYRVAGTSGVERAERATLAFGELRLRQGALQVVQVVGLDPHGRLLRPWNLVKGTANLHESSTAVVVDETELEKLELSGISARAELNGKRLTVVGLTSGIRTFTTAPLVFTAFRRAQQYLRWPSDRFTFVMVKLSPGADAADVKERLAALPGVNVHSVTSIVGKAREYWADLTGIGVTFFSMAVMAVLIGFVVTGQILYNSTTQNLREYATLKAMGAANRSVLSLVFWQALITALLGFGLGATLACGARAAMLAANLVIVLDNGLFAGTCLLTIAMCVVAAMIPAHTLLNLAPNSVLKG
jgi:putative ABC transport system permease protein